MLIFGTAGLLGVPRTTVMVVRVEGRGGELWVCIVDGVGSLRAERISTPTPGLGCMRIADGWLGLTLRVAMP